ncbi:MAG: hypothetical protein JSV16_12540, partial [Candidatus Hydrogenedentota bacterium]
RSRLRHQLIILLVACLVFFWRVIFSSSEKIIAGYDIVVYHYYARVFTRTSMLKGLIPKWNPYEYAGMPFAADPGNCVFYPLNKFFLLMPISKAIGLDMALHVLLAGLGMLLLARAIGLKRGGSLIAAITFMFSGYFIDRVASGHEILIMCSAYLPWIFLCYELASRSGRPTWCILGGVLLGLQVLTGASQPVLYTALFVFVYAIIKNIQRDPGLRLPLLRRDLGYLALIGAVGIGLSAVQLVPSLELVFHSVRAQTTAEFVGSYSFPPRNVIHFLLPYVNVGHAVSNWEYTCYVGILPLAVALTTVLSFGERETRAFAMVGALALLVMLGKHTPLFPILLRIIPGLSLFRIHARAEVGLILAIAVLAGIGWEKIFNSPVNETRKIRRRLALINGAFAATVSVVAILFWLGKTSLSFDIPAPSKTFGFLVNNGAPILSLWHPKIFLPMSAVFITFIAATLLAKKCDNSMKHLLTILIIADLSVMSMGQIRFTDLSYLTSDDALIRSVKHNEGDEYFRVWFPLNAFFASRAKFFGIFDVNGHNALGLRIFEKYLESLSGLKRVRKPPYYEMDRQVFEQEDIFVDNVLNVKYFSVKHEQDAPIFYRADSFFPRTLFVSDYVVGSPEDFLSSRINPETTVILHEQPPRGAHGIGDENAGDERVVIESYANDEIELSVTAPSDGFVVMSEVYYPGWRAEIDGAPAKVLRGNLLLRVVPVTQGTHRVRLFFAPPSLL